MSAHFKTVMTMALIASIFALLTLNPALAAYAKIGFIYVLIGSAFLAMGAGIYFIIYSMWE